MTGRRERRERRTWRAGTERTWVMGKSKWGDESKDERGKKGSDTAGGRAEEGGKGPPPPAHCVCFKMYHFYTRGPLSRPRV